MPNRAGYVLKAANKLKSRRRKSTVLDIDCSSYLRVKVFLSKATSDTRQKVKVDIRGRNKEEKNKCARSSYRTDDRLFVINAKSGK